LLEDGLGGGDDAELGADAVDEFFEGGGFVLNEGEGVEVFEGAGDAVEESPDFGVGGEFGLEIGEVFAIHVLERGVEFVFLLFPVLDVTDAADGLEEVGVGLKCA
jgi:hypothetical protein